MGRSPSKKPLSQRRLSRRLMVRRMWKNNREMASYSPDFLKPFFELYKSFPCMWDETSPEFRDLSKKEEAMVSFVEKFREINAEATTAWVFKKITDLTRFYRKKRETLRRELAKGGINSESPDRWYSGEDLSFLDLPPKPVRYVVRPNTGPSIEEGMNMKEPVVPCSDEVNSETAPDQISVVPSTSSAKSNTDSDSSDAVKQEVDVELKREQDDESSDSICPTDTLNPEMDPSDDPSSISAPCAISEQPRSTTIIYAKEEEDLEAPPCQTSSPLRNIRAAKVPPAVPSSSGRISRKILISNGNISQPKTLTPGGPTTGQKDRFSVFGEYVATKLRSVQLDQTILAERFISEVLYHAERGDLDDEWKFFRLPFYSTVPAGCPADS